MNRIYTIPYFLFILFFTCCTEGESQEELKPTPLPSEKPVEGIRIAWDHRTLRRLSPASAGYAGYARMIELTDGTLYCVFENDGSIQKTTSGDGGDSWSEPVTIATGEAGINAAVPEILQLADNSLLLSYNMRPHGTPVESKRFGIRVRKSTDGVTWTPPVTVYEAGYEFGNGCWEPAQIQLPTGEIQLFIANEGPYTSSNEQEITLFRSIDNGNSWTAGEKVSFRAGHRDGMPVPLILKNTNEIIFAIEDNGIVPPEFKPMIIRTSMSDSWKNAPVLATSASREQPVDKLNLLPGSKYGGAPYIRQLGSGEVILSYQGNDFRKDNVWNRSDMVVCIGDAAGRNFNRKSLPFYTADAAKSSLWNSLSVTGGNTVWAVGSTNAYGNKSEVWLIKGIILKDVETETGTLNLDGERSEALWNKPPHVFIGGYGESNLQLSAAYDNDRLYFAIEVADKHVVTGNNIAAVDGYRLYFDPANKASIGPDRMIYSLGVTASGEFYFQQGEGAAWKDQGGEGIVVKNSTVPTGYRSEIAIPWSVLGGKIAQQNRMGFHVCLYESQTSSQHIYEEPLAGNVNNAPYTWSTLKLK
jgi:hypothetical protein